LSAEEFFEDSDTVVVVGHSAVRKGRHNGHRLLRPHLALAPGGGSDSSRS
jgi:hypothetical protein